MYDLKSLIQNNVVAPVSRATGSSISVGKVTLADEINNSCSVEYVDKDGVVRNRSNIPAIVHGSAVDWFPDVNDYVLVEDYGQTVAIVAKYDGSYATTIRSKMRLVNDIYPDASSESGGCVF